MNELIRVIDGREVRITNPHKLLWPAQGITKLAYIEYLLAVAPYLLPYSRDRLLMSWRYPEGIGTRRIEEKAVPEGAPDWIPRAFYKDKDWILLNDPATLAWVANRAALELHVPFDRYDRPDYPTDLVFDLDPPDDQHFPLVQEVALRLKEVLDSVALRGYAKTSGATGLQVFVPIMPEYTFADTRMITTFIATYIHQMMPDQVTLERVVERRGAKLYFDYLQLWKMRTMPAPYSVRANEWAGVSTPVTWAEVQRGFDPKGLSISTALARLREQGDPFAPVTAAQDRQSLGAILGFIAQRAGPGAPT